MIGVFLTGFRNRPKKVYKKKEKVKTTDYIMNISSQLENWLLEGDPSIRWQVHRDLLFSKKSVIEGERRKTEEEGWCKQLLMHQDKNGLFGGGLYSPKWISTTYTMLLLKDLGLMPKNIQAKISCKILLDKGFYKDGGINYFLSMNCSETCVSGIILSILSYFKIDDDRIDQIAKYLLNEQMKDGGWNCQKYRGATHSSFNTTINVLEGLREYEKAFSGNKKAVIESQNRGREFLLQHKLYKSHRTGEIIDNKMTLFSFPARWNYDILRCLDYFQECRFEKDERMNDAIEILKKRRGKEGTWKLQNKHIGKVFFDLEEQGKPSRMNTLRSLRILKWWEK
jgi:hypothetical protein